MKILYTKSFYKDLERIENKKLSLQLKDEIDQMKKIKNIHEIKNVKKLEGYKDYYRKRIGNYRLGFKLENDIIKLIRFKHRKDIYRVFPSINK